MILNIINYFKSWQKNLPKQNKCMQNFHFLSFNTVDLCLNL